MEPSHVVSDDRDGIETATRVVQLVSLLLYCAVLWQVVSDQPTALDRAWGRARPRLIAAWRRVTIPLVARRQAPFVVWEAYGALPEPRIGEEAP